MLDLNPLPLLSLSDINECSSSSHSCDVNAVCSNTEGSYTCSCKPGYLGDGKSCVGKFYFFSKNMHVYRNSSRAS